MSRHQLQGRRLLIPCLLAVATGCQDATAPQLITPPQFAQGDNGVWTVNSLADPGDGVCDDANCTLREAIAAATSGGSIVFSVSGTILLNVHELVIDQSLSIDGKGLITVDGQGIAGVVRTGGVINTNVTLAGLTLTNGHTISHGGALYLAFGTVTLDNVRVTGSSADFRGGAIHVNGADVTIRKSAIQDNRAIFEGGGISISENSTVRLVESTVSDNVAGQQGGGVYLLDALGGTPPTLDVIGSTITNNQANGGAGGLYVAGGATATIVRSTITSNNAANGGGIRNFGSTLLRSSTVTRNTGFGGGVRNQPGGLVTVANSIVAGNRNPDGAVSDCANPTTSLGHNITANTIGGCDFNTASDIKLSSSIVFTDVLSQTLADNGGPTHTHALITRGRAVDAGSCPGETVDQRGLTRPVDDPVMPNATPGGCDIGAYELQGPVVNTADLMVSQTTDKTLVKQGDLLTYFVRVRNLGPQTAPSVVVSNTLSSGVAFVSAKANKGTLTAPPAGETGTVTWNVGDMLDQANEVVEIAVTVRIRGKTTITNTATVSGNVVDPTPGNNSATIATSVNAGGKK